MNEMNVDHNNHLVKDIFSLKRITCVEFDLFLSCFHEIPLFLLPKANLDTMTFSWERSPTKPPVSYFRAFKRKYRNRHVGIPSLRGGGGGGGGLLSKV